MVKNGDIFGYPDDMVVGAVIGKLSTVIKIVITYT